MPGPGPARIGDDGGSGVHPVEQMVDAAIDRLAREHRASRDKQQQHGLVLRSQGAHVSGRLRWKGLDVSDEFRRYAERVAQGEDLPPYEGRILAEPHPKFPWEPSERKRASRRAGRLQMLLWGSAAMVVGLLSWSLATRIGNAPAPFPTVAIPTPASRAPGEATAGGAMPSETVFAIHGTPSGAGLAPAVTEAPGAPDSPTRANPLAPHPDPAATLSPAAPSPPAPSPLHARSSSQRVAQPASGRELEPTPYPPDVAPPGAIREALAALLAARAEPDEFPVASTTETPAPVEPSASASASSDSSDAPPVVRKETERQSSASESLLVETPSF